MTTPTVTIFGREPAVWVGLIESVLALLLTFQLGITDETLGIWMALFVALGGVVTAWSTKDTLLAALVAALKALLVLATTYWFTLTDQQTAGILAVAFVVGSTFLRTQTSPVARPLDPSPQQVVVRDASALTEK